MSEPRTLVEHFFRHEFGRLCAVLTRSLGVRRLDLVEDVVQTALVVNRLPRLRPQLFVPGYDRLVSISTIRSSP